MPIRTQKKLAFLPNFCVIKALLSQCVYTFLFASLPILTYAELPVACSTSISCGSGVNQFVSSGIAELTSDSINATITQHTNRAILNWKSFNIGEGNSVKFIQPSSTSTALNRIFQGVPSEILGSLEANGQIYLINNNGIVFGDNAQVNVSGLIASTLNISDEVFNDLNIATAIESGLPAFSGGTEEDALIKVEQGALLSAENGGRIFMFAPNVVNEGTISTPGGQTLLAGVDDRVYLYSDADTGIRGLLIELSTGGNVENIGEVIAERGNITLIGQAVRQAGSLSATTSVLENGSIRLLARDSARFDNDINPTTAIATSAGTVTLDESSKIEILPDYDSALDATDAQEQQVSSVEILGKTVHFKKNSVVRATGGLVDVIATTDPSNNAITNIKNDSRILIESGSQIDVSGDTTTTVSVSRNQVAAEIRSNELADVPAQKDGVLQDQEIFIDARIGTELADVSNAIAGITRQVEERLSTGGEVNLRSDGDVILSTGSNIDVSGGQVFNQSGSINTTLLVRGNNVINIGEADPTLRYDAISDATNNNFVSSYVEGKDGGTLRIVSHDAVLEGNLIGGVVQGRFQRNQAMSLGENPAFARSYIQSPELSNFILDLTASLTRDAQISNVNNIESLGFDINSVLDLNHVVKLNSAMLNNSSIGNITLKNQGNLHIADNTNISLKTNGTFDATAGEIEVNGSIVVPSGTINLNTADDSLVNIVDGSLSLNSGSLLDVSGQWVNDSITQSTSFPVIASDGGSVEISATGDVTISRGSVIDASGSAYIDAAGAINAGLGGDLTIKSNRPLSASQLTLDGTLRSYGINQGGSLSIEANKIEINAAGTGTDVNTLYLAENYFTQGGFSSYDITANRNGLTVDASATVNPRMRNFALNQLLAPLAPNGSSIENFSSIQSLPGYLRTPVSLRLESNQSTIADNQLKGLSNLEIEAGASINLDTRGRLELVSDNSLYVDGRLNARAGDISLNIVDPKYFGLATRFDLGFLRNQTLWIGSRARINASGTVIERPTNPSSLFTDLDVLDAGNITLKTVRGFIVAEQGSVLNVSGVSRQVTNISDGFKIETFTDYADAGSIDVASDIGIVLNSTLRAKAASNVASNGKISIRMTNDGGQLSSDELAFEGVSVLPPQVTPTIELSSNDTNFTVARGDDIPERFDRRALVNVKRLQDGGFDNVSFNAINLEATSDISFSTRQSIVLDNVLIDLNDKRVQLASNYISLGPTLANNQNLVPVDLSPDASASGNNGELNVNANFIDLIGDLGITGESNSNIDVFLNSAGDVRLRGVFSRDQLPNGSLNFYGDLTLTADQIYPSTLTEYSIVNQHLLNAEIDETTGDITSIIDMGGVVEINGNGNAAPVLSAAGKLTIESPTIINRGLIKVPAGEINLIAPLSLQLLNGSTTSVSLDNQSIPFGRTEAGDWVYTTQEGASFFTFVFDSLPEKVINLNSSDVEFADGATLNTSGNGNLFAYEHIPGPNGSVDILNSNLFDSSYAIIPTYSSGFAPFDIAETDFAQFQVGQEIVLSNDAGGLSAGRYTLLPARYALLPGAYLIKETPEFDNLTSTQAFASNDGSTLVRGRFAVSNTSIIDSVESRFSVISNRDLGRFAEYRVTSANSYFVDANRDTPSARLNLPIDAGRLVVSATNNLDFLGNLTAGSAGGRGGLIDIRADKIALVDSDNEVSLEGFLTLNADSLERTNAESILIGGIRTSDSSEDGTTLDVQSSEIVVTQGTQFSGNEILLAAKETISLQENSSVSTNTNKNSNVSVNALLIDGDGALLRVSSNDQTIIKRTNTTDSNNGNLILEENAEINASNSVLIDVTNQATLDGGIVIDNGSLNLSANSISLGDDAFADAADLNVNSDLLQTINLNELILSSRSTIDIAAGTNLALDRLIFDAPNVRGYGDIASVDSIVLNDFVVRNTSNNNASDTDTNVVTGAGLLNIEATTIQFGEGQYRIDGYNALNLSAAEAVNYAGTGNLSYSGDSIIITTPLITGFDRASLIINADSADVSISSLAPVSNEQITQYGIGSNLTLNLNSLNLNAAIMNSGGNVNVNASGNITLASNANINVRGTQRDFVVAKQYVPSGNVTLKSRDGNVTAVQDASINISAHSLGGNAGTLIVDAANGAFSYAGELFAQAASQSGISGSVDINANLIDEFSNFNQVLNNAGAYQKRHLRVNSGDIIINAGDQVKANNVQLVSNAGSVTVNDGGIIDASGQSGGTIRLVALDEVSLNAGAIVDASSSSENLGNGGSIELEVSSENGLINISAGSQLDLSAGMQGGIAGDLLGRINADLANNDLADRVTWNFNGPSTLNLLSVNSIFSDGSVSQNDVSNAFGEVIDYLNLNSDALLSEVNESTETNFGLVASVEFQSASDLSTESELDFSTLRYNNRPGTLTIRAVDNVIIGHNINDGFDNNDTLLSEDSWAYNIISGAELGSSDIYSTNNAEGHLTVNTNVSVRTGTGDIALSSGGDITLVDQNSVVYTAGKDAGLGTLLDNVTDGFRPLIAALLNGAQMGRDGGDIVFSAAGNVSSVDNQQFVNQWLYRWGETESFELGVVTLPTMWGINYEQFNQGIGALGGGNVTVNAGNDLSNISISVPTVAIHQGNFQELAGPRFIATDNAIEVFGGGDIAVSVGGDIVGGEFYVEKGTANISAGGTVGSFDEDATRLVLALGDSQVDVTARGDVNLGAVTNPFLLPQASNQALFSALGRFPETYFSTYTANSQVNITSLAGNIVHGASIDAIDATGLNASDSDAFTALRLAPGIVNLTALQGDIRFADSITFNPSEIGGIKALAWGSLGTLEGGSAVNLILSDSDPGILPSPIQPVKSSSDVATLLANNASVEIRHAQTPVHINDLDNSAIVARSGNIEPFGGALNLILSEAVDIFAGNDIVNLNANIQHNRADNISSIQALRDISFPSQRNNNGALVSNESQLLIDGQGRLEVIAGRDINLGSSLGIVSSGNLNNPFLADQGAEILLTAGTSIEKSFLESLSANQILQIIDEFTTGELGNELLANNIAGVNSGAKRPISSAQTLEELARLKQRLTDRIVGLAEDTQGISLSDSQAFEVFDQLTQAEKRGLLSEILFDVLATSATIATLGGTDGGLNRDNFDLGFGIIEAYFPQSELTVGNLSMFNSRIQTLEGGDISIIVPNGQIDAGLPSAVVGARATDEIGIITQREGNINIFARNDVNVNRSRIFALGGGDITFWSSLGNVDAGRGTQAALQIPPPVTRIVDGVPVTEFAAAISGSGIRTASTNPEVSPGNVIFGVPNGVVDAGDAGIDVGGSLILAADEVIGRDNFTVGGDVSGVQLSESGPPITLTTQADSTSASVNGAVDDEALGAAEDQTSQGLGATALKWLEVFVLGFGNDDDSASTNDNEKDKTASIELSICEDSPEECV